MIDTSSSTAGTVIEPATISELPMESRISYLLAGLSPGVHLQDQNGNVAFMWSINALNHPRFGAPDTNPGSSTFGQVNPSQQNQARVIQLALKMNF